MTVHQKTVETSAEKQFNESVEKSVQNDIPDESPLPTLFFSHGGPTFVYENGELGNKGAWRTVNELGKKIKQVWKPDYIVVVSAHWQSGGSTLIEVAVPPKPGSLSGQVASEQAENPLIYDFFGFPDEMYKLKFHSENSPFISSSVQQHLKKSGFRSQITERGIDHGVWVPLKVAFNEFGVDVESPDVPLVQVSLTSIDNDFDTHFELGKSLDYFSRNKIWDPVQKKHLKGLVICSGMSVHNLRDMWKGRDSGLKSFPYVVPFSNLVSDILKNPRDLLAQFNELKDKNPELVKKAHPTLEHFLPLVVAAGTHQDGEKITELYNDDHWSLAWGIYQFDKK